MKRKFDTHNYWLLFFVSENILIRLVKMALYENLNLRREETIPVLLLVLQSVFLGFFLGAFRCWSQYTFFE
jgi:hypothetical protein